MVPFDKEISELAAAFNALGPQEPIALLEIAGEPSLRRTDAAPCEAYRFWVFGTHRFLVCHVIRLERTRDDLRLVAKTCHPANHDIGPWDLHVDRILAVDDFQAVAQLCAASPFWQMPPNGGDVGNTGRVPQFIEGVRDGHYHEITRFVSLPAKLDRAFRLAERLAGLEESTL